MTFYPYIIDDTKNIVLEIIIYVSVLSIRLRALSGQRHSFIVSVSSILNMKSLWDNLITSASPRLTPTGL